MNRILSLVLIALAIFSCNKADKKVEKENRLATGYYKAELSIQDNLSLPFVFKVENEDKLVVFNAEEQIEVDEITYARDSIIIRMPAFEGYIAAKIENANMDGYFIKESLDRVVPFKAFHKDSVRFKISNSPKVDISGNWEVVFSKGIEEDEYIAKGIFKQQGSKVTGTFRTTTGDYRYLEGVLDGSTLKLSTFDGAHAFFFKAEVSDSTMAGDFYSGNHHKEPFEAIKNETYELPSADELTFLNEGYDSLDFAFPNVDGEIVSFNDERFKDKVVLVQIMGTWCPNCLDESKYYADYYKKNKSKDIEIVALAFEYAKTEEKAFNSIERLKERVGIEYPILLAQYGTSSKIEAQQKLPMINHVLSYPTTIFIDKSGKVRKIHTGFNGPATGEKYDEFKSDFTSFMDMLLTE